MMGKDKSEKKVKKEKKEKRSESDGVKKEKKEKHSRKDLTAALENQLEAEKPGSGLESVAATNGVISKVEDDGEAMEADTKVRIAVPKSALVPFANPLADEKQTKKVLRSVKKGTLSGLA